MKPRTLENVLNGIIIRKAIKDPEWGLAAAKQFAKIQFPDDGKSDLEKAEEATLTELYRSDPDFKEQLKQRHLANMTAPVERETQLDDMAWETIENDPTLKAKLVKAKIDELIGRKSSSDTMSEFRDNIKALRDIQNEFGGGEHEDGNEKAPLGGLLTPEVLVKLLDLAPGLLGRGSTPAQVVYEVMLPDGKIQRMDAQQYAEFLKSRQLQSGQQPPRLPAAPVQPENTQPPPEMPVEQPPIEQLSAEQPRPKVSLHLKDWIPYLEKEPQEFVLALIEKLDGLDEDQKQMAAFILRFLREKPIEEIMSMLATFKTTYPDTETTAAIESLEANTDWLKAVIEVAKGSA